jgi:hypothetical protein
LYRNNTLDGGMVMEDSVMESTKSISSDEAM